MSGRETASWAINHPCEDYWKLILGVALTTVTGRPRMVPGVSFARARGVPPVAPRRGGGRSARRSLLLGLLRAQPRAPRKVRFSLRRSIPVPRRSLPEAGQTRC